VEGLTEPASTDAGRGRHGGIDSLVLAQRAAQLLALGDVDGVVRGIVRTTRELLGSDVAYFTMFDEDTGDFYVRATEGFLSEAFLGLRSPLRGFGVYGFIVDHGRPFWSSDYAHDARFPHLPETNQAIGFEGICGLVGAPAPLEGHELPAVVFAGWRTVRDCSDEEVELLVAWGVLAGAVLASTMRTQDMADVLTRVRAARAELAVDLAELRTVSGRQERLSARAAQGGTTEGIAEVLAAELACDVLVLDDSLHASCRVGDRAPDEDDPALREAIAVSRRTRQSVDVPSADGVLRRVVAIVSQDALLGACVIAAERALTVADTRALEHGGAVIGTLLLALERVATADSRVMGDIVTGLLKSPQEDMEVLTHRAARYGVDLNGGQVGLLVGGFEGIVPGGMLDRARRELTGEAALFGLYNAQLVVIADARGLAAMADRLARSVSRDSGASVTIAIVPGPLSPDALPTEHQAATRCVQLLVALGRRGEVGRADELAPFAMAFGGMDGPALAAYVAKAVGPLVDYDAERGTDMLGTLVAFFDQGLNVRATAEVLYLHGNTVRQRLATIGRLVPAFEDPSRRLELHLAARLHQLTVAGAATRAAR
jgi:hypothetical protein